MLTLTLPPGTTVYHYSSVCQSLQKHCTTPSLSHARTYQRAHTHILPGVFHPAAGVRGREGEFFSTWSLRGDPADVLSVIIHLLLVTSAPPALIRPLKDSLKFHFKNLQSLSAFGVNPTISNESNTN